MARGRNDQNHWQKRPNAQGEPSAPTSSWRTGTKNQRARPTRRRTNEPQVRVREDWKMRYSKEACLLETRHRRYTGSIENTSSFCRRTTRQDATCFFARIKCPANRFYSSVQPSSIAWGNKIHQRFKILFSFSQNSIKWLTNKFRLLLFDSPKEHLTFLLEPASHPLTTEASLTVKYRDTCSKYSLIPNYLKWTTNLTFTSRSPSPRTTTTTQSSPRLGAIRKQKNHKRLNLFERSLTI